MARSSRGSALRRSPWRRDSQPIPQEACIRLPGCATASAIWSPSSPKALAPGEQGSGVHRGEVDRTEALAVLRPVEGYHGLLETGDRPPIVALDLVGEAQLEVRQRLQDDTLAGCGEREGTLGGSEGLIIHAHDAAMG